MPTARKRSLEAVLNDSGARRRKGKLTIQQAATGEILVHHPMLSAPSLLDVIPEAVVSNHPEDLAYGPLLDEVPDLHTQREVPGPHGLHQEKVLLLRRLA